MALWKFLVPAYDGKIWVRTEGRTLIDIAKTWSHELQHVADFRDFPGITHLAWRASYFPGSGFARYFLEFRGYSAGKQLKSLLTPFQSIKGNPRTWFVYDTAIFGVGGTTAVAVWVWELFEGAEE